MSNLEIIEEINENKTYLRKVLLKDAEFIYLSLKEESVSKFLSLGPLMSLEHSKKLIKNYLKYWDKLYQYNYIIELRDPNSKDIYVKKVGCVNLWNISWLHKRAEIGIWINSKYWHQGIAKKAINLVKIIAFNHLKLIRLEVHIAIHNTKSLNLFKKCGFIDEGILKKYLNLGGTATDAAILALTH